MNFDNSQNDNLFHATVCTLVLAILNNFGFARNRVGASFQWLISPNSACREAVTIEKRHPSLVYILGPKIYFLAHEKKVTHNYQILHVERYRLYLLHFRCRYRNFFIGSLKMEKLSPLILFVKS